MHQMDQEVDTSVEIMDEDSPASNQLQLIQPPPPPGYQNSKQLTNVEVEPELVPKDIEGGGKSLLSLLANSPKFKTKVLELQKTHPELINEDEQHFKSRHRSVLTVVLQRLRVALWQEFERAIHNNRLIKISQVYAGTCSESTFYSLISSPEKLAYILCAPADYIVMLKEAHNAGLEKLREIFSAKMMDEDGWLNHKAADMVIKAFALLDARLKGAVIQRVDQRVLNATVPSNQVAGALGMPSDMDVLEIELQKARKEIERYTRIPLHPRSQDIDDTLQDSGVVTVEVLREVRDVSNKKAE